ncbi:hypothetical protein C8T65DRAFT_698854 [Cerioporus squamosus]|nr:hypothetical protein C8T65DRAFT_698854 [Cerioporus squamosus]
MQVPTLRNVHIRSAADAHKLFYAVQLGILPKIEKRLDANERAALRPGDVYVWEEKGPNTDSFSVSMERFTEGKSWTASRVRERPRPVQDFLMYFESPKKGKGNARTSENLVVRPGEQDLYIKLTYSVIREDVNKDASGLSIDADDKHKKPPKWHMNAYFTKLTEGQLRTIDDVPELRDLEVPDGIFRSARTTKPGKRGEGSRTATSSVKRLYAPFPNQPTRRVRSQDTPPPVPVPISAGPSSSTSPVAVPDAISQQQSVSSQQQQQSQLASALSRSDLLMFPDEVKPPLTSMPLDPSYNPILTEPTPHYAWGSEVAYAASTALAHQQARMANSHSPTSSEHSMHSFRSGHMSPSLSSASTSSQESPMLMTSTPPLWDNGEPYKPAPILPLDMHGSRGVDLVPLETLPRSHMYRRCPADDRALRLLALGPGAR